MPLEIDSQSSTGQYDANGRLQNVKLDNELPAWKVTMLQVFTPERWRKMREARAHEYMDAVQAEVYAKVKLDRMLRKSLAEPVPATPEILDERTLDIAA